MSLRPGPFVLMLLCCACRHDPTEPAQPEIMPCEPLDVTYTTHIVPILQLRCALPACHVPGGNGTGDFTTYAGVLLQVQNGNLLPAVQRTTGAIPMPPDGSMIPACEIERIVSWVNAGAPEN